MVLPGEEKEGAVGLRPQSGSERRAVLGRARRAPGSRRGGQTTGRNSGWGRVRRRGPVSLVPVRGRGPGRGPNRLLSFMILSPTLTLG